MRGRQSNNIPLNSDHPELEFAYVQDSIDPSESHNQHLLDQAFIIYSDEEMMSVSSHSCNSNLSFDSRSVAFSHCSRDLQEQNIHQNEHQTQNMLGNFSNEQSSICDVRESQCSQSGRELLQSLQPLFKRNNFLRRSPRFVTYGSTETQPSTTNVITKPFKLQKIELSQSQNHQNSEMIEDEKSQLNQHILEQKSQKQILLNNTICSSSNDRKGLIPSIAYTNQLPLFSRITRSSKKINKFQSQSTLSDDNRSNITLGNSNTNEILSQLTKDYILTARKQKKIKKAQKEKLHGTQKGKHHCSRYN